MCIASKVSHVVPVWIVVHYDYYSLVKVDISASLCRRRVASFNLYHNHSVQGLLFLQLIYKLPKGWVKIHTNALKFLKPSLYMVIVRGSSQWVRWNIFHIWIGELQDFLSSEPTNVSTFIVIKNSISWIPKLIFD